MVRHGNPRQREWVGANRDKVRAEVYKSADHCCYCGRPIDWDADPRSRWAPSVEHLTPRSRGGDLFDLANCALAHYGCNARRGNRKAKLYVEQAPAFPTRRW